MNLTPSRFTPNTLTASPLQSGVSAPVTQSTPRFSGDAFEISKKLKEAKAKAIAQEKAFTQIGNTVVWQQGNDTLNVAEMLAYLCRIRKDDKYPGYGTPETLAQPFPGMNLKALKEAFEALTQGPETYLDKGTPSGTYWLRPSGEALLEKLYPDITLPPQEERLTTKTWLNR